MLIQGHWAYHLAFFIVGLTVVNYEHLRIDDSDLRPPEMRKAIDDLIKKGDCVEWESWANVTNELLWKTHLYIFFAMVFREISEAYSLSLFSVKVIMLLTIPNYLSNVVMSGYSLRGATKRHNGWIARSKADTPCKVIFGNSKDWLWVEVLILYINIVYLILFLIYRRLKSNDKLRAMMNKLTN